MRYEDLVIMVFLLLLTMSPINRTEDQMMVLMLNAVVLMLFVFLVMLTIVMMGPKSR